MYRRPISLSDPMAAQSLNLTVVDVYDLAASIGKEFETIIDNYGPEVVTELMPKVINVLEHLEILSTRNQKENAEINDLKYTIERLHAEKKSKAEERARFEEDVEQIEDRWRNESNDLIETITKLQEDNRRLRQALNEQKGQTSKLQNLLEDVFGPGAEDEELQVLTQLKETSDKQRNEIRLLKKDITLKSSDIEALQAQTDRLTRLNTDYRRKTALSQRQARSLLQEKVDLQAQLHDKEQMLGKYHDKVRSDSIESPTTLSPVTEEEMMRFEEKLTLEGKMVVDLKDPNRPRFTLNELRDVLQERNELKTKLIDVEEELKTFKPLEPEHPEDLDDDDECLPVQGPINKEPDEKLYPERYMQDGSVIRKFFKFFHIRDNKGKGRRRSSTPKTAKGFVS